MQAVRFWIIWIVDLLICFHFSRLGEDWHDFCFYKNENVDNVPMEAVKEYEFKEPSRYIFAGAELDYSSTSDSDDYDSDGDEGVDATNSTETTSSKTEEQNDCSEDSISNLPAKVDNFSIDSQPVLPTSADNVAAVDFSGEQPFKHCFNDKVAIDPMAGHFMPADEQ